MGKLYSVGVDITYLCTLRCLHCYNQSGTYASRETELSDEKFMRIFQDIFNENPFTVCLCGGEPLMKWDLVKKVMELHEKLKSNTTVNMVTNSELLDEDKVKFLKDFNLGNVQFSLDGGSAQTHDWLRNKTGVFDKVINALKICQRYSLNVGIAFCPTKRNCEEFDEVVSICQEYGVTTLRVQPLMALGRGAYNYEDIVPSEEQYKKLHKTIMKYMRLQTGKTGLQFQWGDPVDHLLNNNMDKNRFLTISANGEISLTPYIPITVGDLKKHKLREYLDNNIFDAWQSPLFSSIRKKMISPQSLNTHKSMGLPMLGEEKISLDWIEKKEVFLRSE